MNMRASKYTHTILHKHKQMRPLLINLPKLFDIDVVVLSMHASLIYLSIYMVYWAERKKKPAATATNFNSDLLLLFVNN